MNLKAFIAVAIALLIGFGGGYMTSGNETPTGTHVMPDGTSMSDTMASMTSHLDGKTGDEFDKAFIKEMIVHHEGAIKMAQQALQQAKHSEIKQMANDIITAQTREINTMRDWLQSWYKTQE